MAGAAGFIGRSVVQACSKAGHEVRGLVRSPDQLDRVADDGGKPLLGDLLDPQSLDAPVSGCDAVIHLAQPSDGNLEQMRAVRVDGGRNLAAAARRAGVSRLLVGSGYWVYGTNPEVLTETSPIAPMSLSKVNFETEEVVRATMGGGALAPVVARPGMVYGDGSWFGSMVREMRAGSYAFVGDGANYLSPVHRQDAGEAFRVICENWHPAETYLVVDDAPVTTREFATFVSDHLKIAPAQSISLEKASEEWGGEIALLSSASRRASNAKLRSLGWTPRYRSFRDGVPAVLDAMGSG